MILNLGHCQFWVIQRFYILSFKINKYGWADSAFSKISKLMDENSNIKSKIIQSLIISRKARV